MYEKNLKEDLRLRLSENDMNFLRDLSSKRGISISETIRQIIGEYRRSLETLDIISKAMQLSLKEEKLSYGDTETNIDDKL